MLDSWFTWLLADNAFRYEDKKPDEPAERQKPLPDRRPSCSEFFDPRMGRPVPKLDPKTTFELMTIKC